MPFFFRVFFSVFFFVGLKIYFPLKVVPHVRGTNKKRAWMLTSLQPNQICPPKFVDKKVNLAKY